MTTLLTSSAYRRPRPWRFLSRFAFSSLCAFLTTTTANTATAMNIANTPLMVNESISSTVYLQIGLLIVAASLLILALNILSLALWVRYIHPAISPCPLPGQDELGDSLAAPAQADLVEGTK